jgi:hypothetical protein
LDIPSVYQSGATLTKLLSPFALFLLACTQVFSQSATWVHYGPGGTLVYTNDSLGNHLIDYSYAGYMEGGVAIPTNAPIKETLSPSGGDDTANIQNAINTVASMSPNGSGIRGEVFLNPGTFILGGTLSIGTGGVILHGSGTNTILEFTSTADSGTAINIAGSSGTTQIGSTTYNITDVYIPLGATSFHLNTVSGLAVGTNIVVRRPWTTTWINAIGMSNYWTASGHQNDAERTITAISGNRITVDIPLPVPIESQWCTGTVFPYTDSGRVQQCAVENLTMISEWGLGTTGDTNNFGWTGVNFGNAKNCWVRNIAFSGFGGEAVNTSPDTQSKWITAEDCTYANGVNNGSARPGAFQIEGQMCLYQRLVGVSGFEHLCQSLDEATGPNVFLYCSARGQDFDGGPHRFWATSLLTDNEGGAVDNVHITIITGGDNGWGAGYSTFYNCHTTDHLIQCPAITNYYNWWIGGSGTQDSPGSTPGVFDHDGTTATPTSLYLEQLKERLGGVAVENIGYTLFSVSNSPSLQAVNAGNNATYNVIVGDPTLMSNVVALSVSGLPANSSASFNTNSVTGSGNATLTVTASNNIAPGTYTFNVIGSSAGLSHTSQVSLVVGDFSISASPASQAILAGSGASYTVTLATNNGFAGSVNFGLSGLPSGASGSFSPASLSGNGSSTLNITTTTSVSPNNWPLTILGTNGSIVVTTTVSLNVTDVVANAGTLEWTNGAIDQNWSSALNWTNITGGGYGPPGVANDVIFTNISTVGAAGTVNNVINGNFTIGSLTYEQTSGFHTTQIASGATLNITDANGVFAGTGQDNGANETLSATITGAGGELVMNNTGANFNVRQGSASSGSHRATLDVSGLGTMSITAARLLVAGDNVQTANGNRPAGTLLLAQTNMISVSGSSPAINVADDGANGGSGLINLGISNAIYADTITIGREKSSGTLNFNTAITNLGPTLYLRGQTTSRVSLLAISDNSAQSSSSSSSSGLVDFSGGTVDVMANTILLGNGETSSGSGTATGTLNLAGGTINVNTVEAGYQNAVNAGSVASGTVNVNGGTLLVNSLLQLARSAGCPSNAPVGTLNISGGTVQTTNVVGGGGIATINLNNGMLDLQAGFPEPGMITNVSTLNIGSSSVSANAVLQNAADIFVSNTIVIAENGTLAGDTAIIAPGLLINGVISPGMGNLPGGMTNSGAATFGTNGNFVVTVVNANGSPSDGWSFLQNAGQINIQSPGTNPFTINLVSCDTNGSGMVTNFNNNTNYNWTFATAAGGITNFNATNFTVNDSLFANDLDGGYFYVRTNANSLVLAFTNSLPPVAQTVTVYRTGSTLVIPIAELANGWSDPDGDPVGLASVNDSTNGSLLGSDSVNIYYTNANDVADAIFYTVEDIRTNPPAVYRNGDSVRTSTGEIVVLPPPAIGNISIQGTDVVFSGTGGAPEGTYYLLSSTNLLLPLNQWQRIGTNNFDGSGNFNFTNSSSPMMPQMYYLLQLP